jgi:hypothetical protein
MSYDMIDRFLRNNLGDDDYAEYSVALDSLCTPQQRTWVGLNHVERLGIRSKVQEYTLINSVKYGEAIQYATEQALMEKTHD